jgi:hypothetical protein
MEGVSVGRRNLGIGVRVGWRNLWRVVRVWMEESVKRDESRDGGICEER